MSLSDTQNKFAEMKARGFFQQCTNEENLVKLLNSDNDFSCISAFKLFMLSGLMIFE